MYIYKLERGNCTPYGYTTADAADVIALCDQLTALTGTHYVCREKEIEGGGYRAYLEDALYDAMEKVSELEDKANQCRERAKTMEAQIKICEECHMSEEKAIIERRISDILDCADGYHEQAIYATEKVEQIRKEMEYLA